jgi:predicted nucleic acid-binding protein
MSRKRYLAEIAPRRGLKEPVWRPSFAAVLGTIQIIPQDQLEAVRAEATERVGRRDPDDWPAVAAALQLGCPVWTEDDDFFGSGVATWTTGTVEIFLRGS